MSEIYYSNSNNIINNNSIKKQQHVLNNYKTTNTNILKTDNYANNLEQITANSNLQKDRINNYLNTRRTEYIDNGDIRKIYDPIIEKNINEGKLNNTSVKFIDSYLNIDSSIRRKNHNITYYDTQQNLCENPIRLTKGSSLIYFKYSITDLVKDDKIEIGGITKQTFNIIYPGLTKTLIFLKDYIQIFQTHDIDINTTDNFYCEISNFTNLSNVNNNLLFVGNIPLSFINKTHKIILFDKKYNLEYDPNSFYIKLPFKYNESLEYPLSLETRSFVLNLFYINNIPIHKFNTKSPITIYASSSYHVVDSIDSNGFFINIYTNAFWINDDNPIKYIGGKNITVRKIKQFENGYSEPNEYSLNLSKIYKNIVAVELISSEFPCIENTIYKNKSIKSSIVQGFNSNNKEITFTQNNKLYWQNYDDGDYTYSIEITPGKYNPINLAQEIYNRVYEVPRIYYNNQTNLKQPYTNHNFIEVMFNVDQDLVIFKSYVEYIMKYMFKGLFYQNFNGINNDNLFYKIKNKESLNTNNLNKYPLYIIINLNNNIMIKNNKFVKLQNDINVKGDVITLNNILNYYGISGDDLNNIEFEIYEISKNMFTDNILPFDIGDSNEVDDYFMIELNIVNIDDIYNESYNNSIFKLYVSNKIRLLFNYDDTIGSIVGFKNMGSSTSITKWDSYITNKMNYNPDIGVTIIDNDINSGNAIQLCGYNYILIVCDQFPIVDNLSEIKHSFAKIQLSGSPGTIVYNSFVKMPKLFYVPINEINKLSFKILSPNGELYDFNGLDHSFTIKITTIEVVPIQTRISSQNDSNV